MLSRFDAGTRREYLVALNAGTTHASARVGTSTPSARWTTLLGASGGEASDATGTLTVGVPPLSAKLLVAVSSLPLRAPAAPKLTTARDDLTDLVELSVPATPAPVSVAFAVSRGTGWRRLAVDDSPPYRAFLDPAAYRRRETVHVVAVARGLNGRVAQSRVVPLVPRKR